MTVKQLAQRLGCEVKQLDFELEVECKNCSKTGGTDNPCEGRCLVAVSAEIRQADR
jgi:hypothetical protein